MRAELPEEDRCGDSADEAFLIRAVQADRLERHWREFPGGMERLTITGDSGFLINGLVLPSRGGVDPRQTEYLANARGGMTTWKGNIANGDIV